MAFLLAEAGGAVVWWLMLLARPDTRAWFLPCGAPDVTLLAFALPDAVLFIGTAVAAAVGLRRNRRWAWPALCVHAGAAAYAGLYCWMLTALSGGEAWAGAVLMTPSVIVAGILAWVLRPRTGVGDAILPRP